MRDRLQRSRARGVAFAGELVVLDRPLGHARLVEVARRELRLRGQQIGEAAREGEGDPRVQRATRRAQQRSVGGLLDQRMPEDVGGLPKAFVPEQQLARDQALERGPEGIGLRVGRGFQQPYGNSRPITEASCAISSRRRAVEGA